MIVIIQKIDNYRGVGEGVEIHKSLPITVLPVWVFEPQSGSRISTETGVADGVGLGVLGRTQ